MEPSVSDSSPSLRISGIGKVRTRSVCLADRLGEMLRARPPRRRDACPSARQLEPAGGHRHGAAADARTRGRCVHVEGAGPAHLDALLDQE